MDLIAEQVGTQRVEVEGTASFYAFLSNKPRAKWSFGCATTLSIACGAVPADR